MVRRNGRHSLTVTSLFLLLLACIVVAPVVGQEEASPAQQQILDLVERFEQTRQLLREQIRLNAELFTQEEIDEATAELEAEIERLQAVNERLRIQYKALLTAYRDAEDESLAYKELLTATERGAAREISTLNAVIDSIEEENLLQVGATFSPSGALGLIGIFNLPGTNVGLVSGASWVLRDRAFSTSFGVTFSYLPQGLIVEGWQRLRSRLRRDEQSGNAPQAPVDDLPTVAPPSATPLD